MRPPHELVLLLLGTGLAVLTPSTVTARHRARLDPTEPIFTQRGFLEKDLELDVGVEHGQGDDTVELTGVATWVFANRLEVDVEIPFDIRIPDDGPTVGGLSDVDVAAQLLLCCAPTGPLDYFSVRAEVAAPSGDRAKSIGGDGEWSLSLLPSRRFTIVNALPDLFIQGQLTWAQAIQSPGDAPVEKEVDWNFAFTQKYVGGRVRPVLELLGTTTVAAADAADIGTVVELAVGVWTVPFPDEHALSALSVAAGWRWPMTDQRQNNGMALLILQWTFD